MNRNLTEKLKFPEGWRVPLLGGWIYRLVLRLDNRSILREPLMPLNTEPREERLIASLTSYPARIDYVHIAVRALMRQTCPPDEIWLWLAREQFPDGKLPDSLTALIPHGLQIRWTDDDTKGHKKVLPAVAIQQPNELIVSFDDDIIYAPRVIERLMKTHREHPDCVVVDRGQVLDPAHLNNPGRWNAISPEGFKTPTYRMNPSGGSGFLIPYGYLHPDTTDVEKVRELALCNDDLWFMFMCAAQGTRLIRTHRWSRPLSVAANSQTEQLAFGAILEGGNARAIEKLRAQYPVAWQRILTDQD